MIWENGIETCKLSYVKWITSPGSRHETGCSGLVHWDDLEGRDGEGVGNTDKLGVTCWWWKKPQNRRYPCPWITHWMRAKQKIHLIQKACIVVFREGKVSFCYDENPHSLFFFTIAPRIKWERSLRTEDPENLSMRKKFWRLSIENTSLLDIRRYFKWWSKDLYTKKDILFCFPHLFLENHDFHFRHFSMPEELWVQLFWTKKQKIMEYSSKC